MNSTSLVYRRNHSLYEAYKKQYLSNTFGNTNIEAGTKLVDRKPEEKKKR